MAVDALIVQSVWSAAKKIAKNASREVWRQAFKLER
jgi:hypothetical protein